MASCPEDRRDAVQRSGSDVGQSHVCLAGGSELWLLGCHTKVQMVVGGSCAVVSPSIWYLQCTNSEEESRTGMQSWYILVAEPFLCSALLTSSLLNRQSALEALGRKSWRLTGRADPDSAAG